MGCLSRTHNCINMLISAKLMARHDRPICYLYVPIRKPTKPADAQVANEAPAAAQPTAVHECDDRVAEYLSGSQRHATVIPYSAACVRAHVNATGGHVPYPPTTLARLAANPKTGSTWVLVLVSSVLQKVCASGLYHGCVFHQFLGGKPNQQQRPTNKASLLAVPSAGGGYRVLRWLAGDRHKPPMTPKGVYFQNMSPASWKNCVYRTPYERIQSCLDFDAPLAEGHDVVLDPPTQEWLHEEGMSADMAGARWRHLYLARDPRDEVISWLHYTRFRGPQDATPARVNQEVSRYCKHFVAWAAFHHYWIVD